MNECPECKLDLNWITDTEEVIDKSENLIYCSMDCVRDNLRCQAEKNIEEYIKDNVDYV